MKCKQGDILAYSAKAKRVWDDRVHPSWKGALHEPDDSRVYLVMGPAPKQEDPAGAYVLAWKADVTPEGRLVHPFYRGGLDRDQVARVDLHPEREIVPGGMSPDYSLVRADSTWCKISREELVARVAAKGG